MGNKINVASWWVYFIFNVITTTSSFWMMLSLPPAYVITYYTQDVCLNSINLIQMLINKALLPAKWISTIYTECDPISSLEFGLGSDGTSQHMWYQNISYICSSTRDPLPKHTVWLPPYSAIPTAKLAVTNADSARSKDAVDEFVATGGGRNNPDQPPVPPNWNPHSKSKAWLHEASILAKINWTGSIVNIIPPAGSTSGIKMGPYTQYLDKAWEKKTGIKQLKPPSSKIQIRFYKKEDLDDGVKPCEIYMSQESATNLKTPCGDPMFRVVWFIAKHKDCRCILFFYLPLLSLLYCKS